MDADDLPEQTGAPETARTVIVTALLSALLVVLPLLAVRYPPITDLPQQLAQVRLGSEALGGGSPYRLNPLAPGGLVYALFGLASLVSPPLLAGRLVYALLAGLWVAGLALVVAARRRPATSIPLLALLFFSHPLYWGFASFLLGAALFCFWIVLEERTRRGGGGSPEVLTLTVGLAVLYVAHAFWCLAGSVWLVAATLAARGDHRRLAWRLAPLAVPAFLAAAWWSQLAASGFVSETIGLEDVEAAFHKMEGGEVLRSVVVL